MCANYATAPHLACNEKSLTTTKTVNEQNTYWGNELKWKCALVKTNTYMRKNKTNKKTGC